MTVSGVAKASLAEAGNRRKLRRSSPTEPRERPPEAPAPRRPKRWPTTRGRLPDLFADRVHRAPTVFWGEAKATLPALRSRQRYSGASGIRIAAHTRKPQREAGALNYKLQCRSVQNASHPRAAPAPRTCTVTCEPARSLGAGVTLAHTARMVLAMPAASVPTSAIWLVRESW